MAAGVSLRSGAIAFRLAAYSTATAMFCGGCGFAAATKDGIGFFAYLGGGARVVSLGIADARVEGQMNVGALAGEVLATVDAGLEDARLEDVWAWGRVFGSNGSLTTGVGGLVGRLEGGQIVRGWFGGHVEDGDSTGGLVGFAERR